MASSPPLLRIYVIEDSDAVRSRIVKLVHDQGGIECVGEAGSVSEAIDGIERLEPAAILLDLHLIGGTGLEVLRAVKPTRPDLRVAVLTSFANDQYRTACTRAGADFVLDKIDDIGRLPGILGQWVAEAGSRADAGRDADR